MPTVRHCPGCKGYTHASDSCAGIPVGSELTGADLIVPDIVPPLGLRDRLRVLFGYPVLMGVAAGPVGEPFEVVDEPLRGWVDEIDGFRDAG